MGLLVGASVLLAVRHWQRGRLPNAVLLVVAVLPAFVKLPFVLPAVRRDPAGRREPGRAEHVAPRPTGASILIGGAAAGALLWQQARVALAVGVPIGHPDVTSRRPSTPCHIPRLLPRTIPVISGAPIRCLVRVAVAVQPLAWLLLAASLGGLLLRRRDDPLLPGLLGRDGRDAAGSIVLSLIVFIGSGGVFLGGTPRYGLALLPLFAVPLMCTRHPLAVLAYWPRPARAS